MDESQKKKEKKKKLSQRNQTAKNTYSYDFVYMKFKNKQN